MTPHALSRRPAWLAAGLLPILTVLPACTPSQTSNPSFPLTVKQAKAELAQMRRHPVTLKRPVVVLGGWGDVLGLPPASLAKQLRQATGDDRILSIGFGGCTSFDACRARVMERVDKAFGSDDDGRTAEVDVIGFSMGGIVARYAATPPPEVATDDPTSRRLNIARLYTLCSPHRGALLATVIAPGELAMNMRPDSAFMQQLDAQLESADYPIIPYARLKDYTVGTANAAPQGVNPWWIDPTPFTVAHSGAYRDPRIIADLARRLRGEKPYTTEPASPLP